MAYITKQILNTYKYLASIPVIQQALILQADKCGVTVEAAWSIENLIKKQKTITEIKYSLSEKGVQQFSPVIKDSKIIASANYKNEKNAYIYQDDDSMYLTIIDSNGKTSSTDLKESNLHGKVYGEGELSAMSWSPDGSKLLYLAEKKRPKGCSFFEKSSNDAEKTAGGEFEYIDDWGEQMNKMSESVVVIASQVDDSSPTSDHEALLQVLALPEGLCASQVCWHTNGTTLYGVALKTEPYRLGLIYCRNRDSTLFQMNLDGIYTPLYGGEGGLHVNFPRLNHTGTKLAFFTNPSLGPHVQNCQLCIYSCETQKVDVVIDYIDEKEEVEGGWFHGLYGSLSLPDRCWVNDNTIITTSHTPHATAVFIIDSSNGAIIRLPVTGLRVLDVFEGWCLCTKSAIDHIPQLLAVQIPQNNEGWNFIELSPLTQIDGMTGTRQDKWEIDVEEEDGKKVAIPVLFYCARQENENQQPLIVFVHGGPHAVFQDSFMASICLFVQLGFNVVLTNYRGSLGQGRKALNALPGHCGTMDVNDVHQVTLACIKRYPSTIDPKAVFLYGGSHGGFIVTHLAAQYPDTYKAVAARNPVTNIASMVAISDITDWTYVETGLTYTQGQIPDADTLAAMLKVSPLALINKVKAPTLLLLGKNDRRAPMSQGLIYHKMLKARGVPTKAFVYDDCHSLGKVEVAADGLMQTIDWFKTYQ